MKYLASKKALITGAAAGIGREIVLALAREGVDVFLVDINEQGLADVAKEARDIGVTAATRRCDLTEPDEISTMVQELLSQWGGVDILVNNAGVVYYGPTVEMNEDQWDRLLSVNLLAPIRLVRELLPALIARGEAHILNMSSLSGLVALNKFTAYQVSKFGLQGLTESLRIEYAKYGIGVTAVCPGFVDTNLMRNSAQVQGGRSVRLPPHWLCTPPQVVAKRAVKAIRKNRPLVVISPMSHFLWRLKRLSPSLFLRLAGFRWKRRRPPVALPVPNFNEDGRDPVALPIRKPVTDAPPMRKAA